MKPAINLIHIFEKTKDKNGEEYYVQRYVGHAPATIGERHYHGDQGKRLLPLFREKVVSYIDKEMAMGKAPVDSRIIPGPEWW